MSEDYYFDGHFIEARSKWTLTLDA